MMLSLFHERKNHNDSADYTSMPISRSVLVFIEEMTSQGLQETN